jgi:DNA-binding NtrC family response regulator
MLIENSNLDVHVLVLARSADSMCSALASALREWGYAFSFHATAYEVVNEVENLPTNQSAVLIARPAMLGPQAAIFIERHFRDLQVIGWIDSGENISDCAIAQTTASGMMTASHLDQLQQIIHRCCKAAAPSELNADAPKKSGRLEYELSNDEVNALLGVE